MAATIPVYSVFYYDPTRRSNAGTAEHSAVFPRTASGKVEAEKFARSVRAIARDVKAATVTTSEKSQQAIRQAVAAGRYGSASRVLANVGTRLADTSTSAGGGGTESKAGSGRSSAG